MTNKLLILLFCFFVNCDALFAVDDSCNVAPEIRTEILRLFTCLRESSHFTRDYAVPVLRIYSLNNNQSSYEITLSYILNAYEFSKVDQGHYCQIGDEYFLVQRTSSGKSS